MDYDVSTALRNQIIDDLLVMEDELNNPSFHWNGDNYGFIPSISEFDRELETGGFSTNQMLTATVRKLDSSYNSIFAPYPTAQDKIIYNMDGSEFRIESIKHDATGAYFRLVAVSTVRGI